MTPLPRIVDEGENYAGNRLITIEIPADTNLFKYEAEYLPLFAGWSRPSGDTIHQDDKFATKPARLQPGEHIKEYLARLQDYNQKLAMLNQWFLTLQSRDAHEDMIILLQMKALNDLDFDRFQQVILFSIFEHFPPTGTSGGNGPHDEYDTEFSERKLVTDLLNRLAEDPLQTGDTAIWNQDPNRERGKLLGELCPPELDGFGIQIRTWNYATIECGYKDKRFHWYRATFCDDEQENMDLTNPAFFIDWDNLNRITLK